MANTLVNAADLTPSDGDLFGLEVPGRLLGHALTGGAIGYALGHLGGSLAQRCRGGGADHDPAPPSRWDSLRRVTLAGCLAVALCPSLTTFPAVHVIENETGTRSDRETVPWRILIGFRFSPWLKIDHPRPVRPEFRRYSSTSYARLPVAVVRVTSFSALLLAVAAGLGWVQSGFVLRPLPSGRANEVPPANGDDRSSVTLPGSAAAAKDRPGPGVLAVTVVVNLLPDFLHAFAKATVLSAPDSLQPLLLWFYTQQCLLGFRCVALVWGVVLLWRPRSGPERWLGQIALIAAVVLLAARLDWSAVTIR